MPNWWDNIKETGVYDKIVNDGKLPSMEFEVVVPNRTLYRVAIMVMAIVVVTILVARITKPSNS